MPQYDCGILTLLILFGLLHGKTDTVALFINFKNNNIDNITDLNSLTGMAQAAVCNL